MTALRSLDKPKHVVAFKKWLAQNGASVLKPTNQFERVRFRGSSGASIIYKGRRGYTFVGQARAAWDAFATGCPYDLSAPAPVVCNAGPSQAPMSEGALLAHAAREPVTVAFVMRANTMPMRAAAGVLFDAQRRGLLTRSGGELGSALVWRAVP